MDRRAPPAGRERGRAGPRTSRPGAAHSRPSAPPEPPRRRRPTTPELCYAADKGAVKKFRVRMSRRAHAGAPSAGRRQAGPRRPPPGLPCRDPGQAGRSGNRSASAGGGRAGRAAGASVGRPRWPRIFPTTSLASMVAITAMRPPHRGHARTSTSKTRCIKRAHVQFWPLAAVLPVGLGAPERSSCAPGLAGTIGGAGEGPGALPATSPAGGATAGPAASATAP